MDLEIKRMIALQALQALQALHANFNPISTQFQPEHASGDDTPKDRQLVTPVTLSALWITSTYMSMPLKLKEKRHGFGN
jgi:hypothetical protein